MKTLVTRRRLLGSSAVGTVLAIAGAMSLAACNKTPAEITQAVIDKINAVSQALLAGLTQLGAIAGAIVPSNTTVGAWIAAIGGYVAKIAALAGQVQQGLAAAAAQPVVQQIVSIFRDLLTAVTGVGGLPASWLAMLGNVQSVIATVMSLLGIPVSSEMMAARSAPDPMLALQDYTRRYAR